MIILDDSLSLTALAGQTTNGLGSVQPIEALVTEELNGAYELAFSVSADDLHFQDLHVGGIVKVKAGMTEGLQMFRVYQISKPLNGIVQCQAEHISYDLNKYVIGAFIAGSAALTADCLTNDVLNSSMPFTITTDITSQKDFVTDIPRSVRECLGGWEGSVLDIYRPEYEFDNLTVRMLNRRGADNGVRISYGKNLTDINQEENCQEVYTAAIGYALNENGIYRSGIHEKVHEVPERIMLIDFSEEFDDENLPTEAALNALTSAYVASHDINVPKVNLEISFVNLADTQEYRNVAPLEMVSLGDTVRVDFPKLNVTATARVVSRVWDVNKDRYESVTLGSARANMSDVISSAVTSSATEITESLTNKLNAAVNEQDATAAKVRGDFTTLAQLVINGMGLHSTVQQAGSGYVYYLHNKQTLAQSDTQYMITSSGFVVSTDYGQTWNAGFDAQGNAVLNSLSTITLNALDIHGSNIYGTTMYFGDTSNDYIVASTYTSGGNSVGVSFDGTGYVRFQPQEQFEVRNLADGNTAHMLNRIIMSGSSTGGGNAVNGLYNFNTDYSNANQVVLYSNYTNSGYNRLHLYNYSSSGTSANWIIMRSDSSIVIANNDTSARSANVFNMYATSSENYTIFNNYQFGANTSIANRLRFNADGTTNYVQIWNNKVNTTNRGTSLEMSASSTETSVQLNNYLYSSNVVANTFQIRSNSSQTQFIMLNGRTTDAVHNSMVLEKNASHAFVSFDIINGSTNMYFSVSTQSGVWIGTGSQGIAVGTDGSVSINGHLLTFTNGYVRYSG